MRNVRVCSRCVYDDTVPNITFDENDVCNYCQIHNQLDRDFPTGAEGEQHLEKMFDNIRRDGRGKKYDCVIGVSGGVDSSYLMHMAVKRGLRPLAAHFDNTWNSPIATQNIYNVLSRLNIDLFTYVIDNAECNDIYSAFIEAGLSGPDTATDVALATVAYMAATKYNIGYILDGHTFRTEGVAPIGSFYFDGKYIESVHRRFGSRPMKTFPNLTLLRFVRWTAMSGIRRLRPLWYAEYDKDAARKFLVENYGWVYYGGHHLENYFSAFNHLYILPRRGVMDSRLLSHAANVRSGFLDRNDALDRLRNPQACPPEVLQMVKTRLGYSDADLERLMSLPLRSWKDFTTYKKVFEWMRPFFWVMLKLKRIPDSFYRKYCFPLPEEGA